MSRRIVVHRKPVQPKGEFLRLSHDLTEIIDDMAGRDDLYVKIDPEGGIDHEGEKHPAVMFPLEGTIEVNAEFIPDGVDPATMEPLEYGDRQRYPEIWGLLAHEAGHAQHTKWSDRILSGEREVTKEEEKWVGAATLLEEPRVEHRQMQRRPQDQIWMQASATKVIAGEVDEALKEIEGLDKEEISKKGIARAALLILARVDGGTIDPSEMTGKVRKLAKETFGEDYSKLEAVWREALDTGDDDTEKMLDLGHQWYDLTKDDGTDGEGTPIVIMVGGSGEGAEGLGGLLDAMAEDASGEASGENERQRRRVRLAQYDKSRSAELARQAEAKKQASKVFHAGPDAGSTYGRQPIISFRNPFPEEVSRARTTRKGLQAAYVPERAIVPTSSMAPPGRLGMRAAMQASAQVAMGLPVEAEPFTRKQRTHTPIPPLKVGIAQDVSGSQDRAAEATVSGAWSLAKAATMITDAQVAMVTFGDYVHKVFGPHERVDKVPVISARSGSHHLKEALDALEGELHLMTPGYARLLVILTDGIHETEQMRQREPMIKRYIEAGVRVLWFVTDGGGYSPSHGGYDVIPHIRGMKTIDEYQGQFDQIPKLINREAVGVLK